MTLTKFCKAWNTTRHKWNKFLKNWINKQKRKPTSKMNKVRKICLIIVACVLVIAAGVMVYLTVQSGKSSNSASEVATSKTVSKNKHKGSSTSSSSLSQSSSSEESSSDDQSSKFAQSGWSSDQEAQLASFMNRFGTKMKQKYKEYNGQESIETLAGEKYPDDFNNRTFKTIIARRQRQSTSAGIHLWRRTMITTSFRSSTAMLAILNNILLICSAFMMANQLL